MENEAIFSMIFYLVSLISSTVFCGLMIFDGYYKGLTDSGYKYRRGWNTIAMIIGGLILSPIGILGVLIGIGYVCEWFYERFIEA